MELPAALVGYLELVAGEIWPTCDYCVFYEANEGDCLRHAPRPVSLRLVGSPREDTFASVYRPFVCAEHLRHACGELVAFRDLVDFERKRFVDPNETNTTKEITDGDL